MDKSILNEGVSELYVARDILVQLQEDKEHKVAIDIEEEKLEKVIVLREKQMNDEITSTLKIRKDEVEKTYNTQINEIKVKLKKLKAKKEKFKTRKVSERIQYETEDLREANSKMKQEINSIIKDKKLPSISRNNLFYSLFMPKGIKDFFHIFLCLLVALVLIPCFIYYLILPTQRLIYLLIIYVIVVVVIAIIYMLIENNIKDKYHDSLKDIRIIKQNMRKNNIEQNRVKQGIKRDKDETVYQLEDFDTDINGLNEEINRITNLKDEALQLFDKQSKLLIIDEIKLKYKSDLDELKDKLNLRIKERKGLEDKITMTLLHYSNNYEVFIGKEFIKIEIMNQLIELMQDKGLSTVSEGLAEYRNNN